MLGKKEKYNIKFRQRGDGVSTRLKRLSVSKAAHRLTTFAKFVEVFSS